MAHIQETSARSEQIKEAQEWIDRAVRLLRVFEEYYRDVCGAHGITPNPNVASILDNVEVAKPSLPNILDEPGPVDGLGAGAIGQLLHLRDGLIRGDINMAYHILYKLADPGFNSISPWERWEKAVKDNTQRPTT